MIFKCHQINYYQNDQNLSSNDENKLNSQFIEFSSKTNNLDFIEEKNENIEENNDNQINEQFLLLETLRNSNKTDLLDEPIDIIVTHNNFKSQKLDLDKQRSNNNRNQSNNNKSMINSNTNSINNKKLENEIRKQLENQKLNSQLQSKQDFEENLDYNLYTQIAANIKFNSATIKAMIKDCNLEEQYQKVGQKRKNEQIINANIQEFKESNQKNWFMDF